MNDTPDTADAYLERRLATFKSSRPTVSHFFQGLEKAAADGVFPELHALVKYAEIDPALNRLVPELFHRPTRDRSTLFLKALHATRNGEVLPVEDRSELLHTLMQAGVVPRKSPKGENPLALLVEQNFPDDILVSANNAVVYERHLPEGTIMGELKPRLKAKSENNGRQWAVRREIERAYPDPKAGVRSGHS